MLIKDFANIPVTELEERVKEWVKSTPKFQLVQATQSEGHPGHITLTIFYYPVPAK